MTTEEPGFVRRQLGRRLRQMREEAGKTLKSVADAKICSESKLQRIERGTATARVGDIWALCRFYDAPIDATDALAKMAEATSQDGWWEERPGVVAEWARMYMGLEASCRLLWAYHPELIHGLLQTDDFARGVAVTDAPQRDDVVEDRLKLRKERQRILDRPGRDLRFILGTGVLQLQIGSSSIMEAQFEHLRELNTRDGVDIRFLPGTVGAHPGLSGRFMVMEFEDPDDKPVAYLESLTGARYLEHPRQVEQYRTAFETLHRLSSPIEEFLP